MFFLCKNVDVGGGEALRALGHGLCGDRGGGAVPTWLNWHDAHTCEAAQVARIM